MHLPIVSLYSLPAATIYLILWFRVSAVRGETGVSFGDGGHAKLLRRIRQHGNCAEWTVFLLLLMILAESAGVPAMWLHISGALLIAGRLAHPFGLKSETAVHPLRYVGNGSNLLATLNLMVWIGLMLPGQ